MTLAKFIMNATASIIGFFTGLVAHVLTSLMNGEQGMFTFIAIVVTLILLITLF